MIFQQTHRKIAIAFERSVDDSLMLERNRFARQAAFDREATIPVELIGQQRHHVEQPTRSAGLKKREVEFAMPRFPHLFVDRLDCIALSQQIEPVVCGDDIGLPLVVATLD